jgi:hypothetical protein
VVPVRPQEIGHVALELLRAQSNFQALSGGERRRGMTAEMQYVVNVLGQVQRGAWDRAITDLMSPGQASYILSSIFTPTKIPRALIEIYGAFNSIDGTIVSYNYDNIAKNQSAFPVIFPHGTVSSLFTDPRFSETTIRLAREFHTPISNDWHLPMPESELIRYRDGYQDTLLAWRNARSVVLVGFAFGRGADATSFDDFGRALAPSARVHVVCPGPDNADLAEQVRCGLRGRKNPLTVYPQPFGWRSLAEALLWLLECLGKNKVWHLIGREALVGRAHDDGGRPAWAQFWWRRSELW